MKFQKNGEKNWTKSLYIRHNRADNHVDKSFLALKKINRKKLTLTLEKIYKTLKKNSSIS